MKGILNTFSPESKLEMALDVAIFENRPCRIGYPEKLDGTHDIDPSTITRITSQWHNFLLANSLSEFVTIERRDDKVEWYVDMTAEGKELLQNNGMPAQVRMSTVTIDEQNRMRDIILNLFERHAAL